jgi:glycerol-1-phosphate dehydrogenase [NAD(P)+]
VNIVSAALALQAAHLVFSGDWRSLTAQERLARVLDGQVFSGLAMAICGSSRPCSGSEHLIAHAFDAMGLGAKHLHGVLVGSSAAFTLYLQAGVNSEVVAFLRTVDISPRFSDYLPSQDPRLLQDVFRVARSTRPGRVTVFDEYSDTELVEHYEEYCDQVT